MNILLVFHRFVGLATGHDSRFVFIGTADLLTNPLRQFMQMFLFVLFANSGNTVPVICYNYTRRTLC